MDDVSISFETLAEQFAGRTDVAVSKWFGKTCLKVDGKAFVVLFGRDLAFKLAEEARSEALGIEGAHLFDPRGQGNPFREWVQVPSAQSRRWPKLAEDALIFVSSAKDG